MQFDSLGHLSPYHLHESDLQTLEAVFVTGFPDSQTRRPIFERYLAYLDELRGLVGGGFLQWVDGSFVTRKADPRDVDFVTFLPIDVMERQQGPLNELRRKRREPGSVTDGYFVATYPEGHPLRTHYEADRLDWLETFGKTQRTRRGERRHNKGIIQLTF